jgi:hypothetical protein
MTTQSGAILRPTISVEGLAQLPQIQGGSLQQLGGTLVTAVETFQAIVLKIQKVVQLVFAELLERLSSIMSCFQSFNAAIAKLEEALSPKPVVAIDLGTSIKQILASLNLPVAPTGSASVSPSSVKTV